MGAFEGKSVVITGAASGIGQAIALAFAHEAATLFLADLSDTSETLDLLADSDCEHHAFHCDVADVASVDLLFDNVEKTGASPDVVINSAGILIESPVLEMTEEDFDRQIAVNLKGSFLIAKAALSCMSAKGTGRLILIASELGYLGRADFSAYCASKAAVIGLTRSLAREFAPDILVNAIAPGPIDTPMLGADSMSPEWAAKEANNPMGRIGKPEEVAGAALFLASPAASFMTGQTISPSGGAVML
ncbi:MAG: SDR family NAD(P)-dependent oxidoreductase [Pseudomonadota bacterium]